MPTMPGKKRVLVADNEAAHRTLVTSVLVNEGHHVETVDNGLAAIHAIRQTHFDLVLLDIRMAPVDGLEVLERIKRDSPSTKVIIITAYPSSEHRKLAFERGADDYLLKPFTLQELRQRIVRILAGAAEAERP